MIQLHRWALSGAAVGVCGALLLCAPAAWLASGIAQASAGKILLEEPRGTVWSGSAQLVFAGGTGSATAVRLPSSVQWHLAPVLHGSGSNDPAANDSAALAARRTQHGLAA
jgi:general secretion pathway protein N